jgi:hypothetical protein
VICADGVVYPRVVNDAVEAIRAYTGEHRGVDVEPGTRKRAKMPLRDIFYRLASSDRLQADTILSVCDGKRFFVTDTGHIGLTCANARVGDQVWVLEQVRMPFACRMVEDEAGAAEKRNTVRLLGACYIHGVMSGEVWEEVMGQSEKRRVEELIVL